MPMLQGLHLQTITLYTRVSAGENPGLYHPAMRHRMYQKPNHWHIPTKEDSRVLIRGSPFRGCIWSRMQNKWKHLRFFSPCDVVQRMYTYVTPCYFLLHLTLYTSCLPDTFHSFEVMELNGWSPCGVTAHFAPASLPCCPGLCHQHLFLVSGCKPGRRLSVWGYARPHLKKTMMIRRISRKQKR